MLRLQVNRELGALVRCDLGALESCPLTWKFMAHRQQAHRSGGSAVVDALLEICHRSFLEQIAALTRGVLKMKDYIRNRVIVELPHIPRQLELPVTDSAGILERLVAIVAPALKHPGVIERRAGHDRLQ